MLIKQIRTLTDDTWDKCWPVSTLRPLALLDLISYLFFIKKTGEEGLMHDLLPELPVGINYPQAADDLSWNKFKDLDPQSMHHLFIKENGVMELMSYYANAHLRYSDYFKAPLLITPSVILLTNAVALVKIMEVTDEETQGLILEHLVSKSAITSQQGQVYIPEDISQLIISILQPASSDIVWDPALGNASLLVNSSRFITKGHQAYNNTTAVLKGMEGDLVQLRIGAMNMMLHHIENPELKILDKGSLAYPVVPAPSVIISNLFFTGVETNSSQENKTIQESPHRKEMDLLQYILKNLQQGCRAAVVVPDTILTGGTPEVIKLREEIILHTNLEGVLSIANHPLLYGGAILIFNKNKIATEKVWFAEITHENAYLINRDFESANRNILSEVAVQNKANSIYHLWSNKDTGGLSAESNGFYIGSDAIINNNFNLGYSANKLLQTKKQINGNQRNAFTENNIMKPTPVAITIAPLVKKEEELISKPEEPFDWGKDVVGVSPNEDDYTTQYQGHAPKRLKWLKPLLYSLLVLSIIGNVIFFLNNNNKSTVVEDKRPASSLSTPRADETTSVANSSTSENILATKKPEIKSNIDSVKNSIVKKTPVTSTINPIVKPADIKKSSTEDALKITPSIATKNIPEKESTNIPAEPNASDARNTRYAVISKAVFYAKPNEHSHITGSITNYDNGELISSTEKNGFVYAIFYNKDGNNLSGWLNMNDLKLVE